MSAKSHVEQYLNQHGVSLLLSAACDGTDEETSTTIDSDCMRLAQWSWLLPLLNVSLIVNEIR